MDDNITITGAQGASDTITIDTSDIGGLYGSSMNSYSFSTPSYGAVTISTAGGTVASGNYLYSNGTSPIWSTGVSGLGGGTIAPAGLHVSSDATFDGDIKWQGRSLGKLLEAIEDRLAILTEPSPEKLEKYAALKKAYDHYKLLEKLIGDD